ncbi:MAG: PIN domain-containing protein [Candidatus Bathyarchaeia archaeon]
MYLVDTNIFLEVLLGRDKKEECKKILRTLRDGKESAIVTDFSIHSIIVILDELGRLDALKTFLLSLLAYKGLHIYNTTISDEVKAIEIAKKQNLSMDDAIQYASALSTNAEAIISLDKHFNNLKIPRIEPS